MTASVFAAGALPPTVAANASEAGATASAGGAGAVTVSVTGIVAGAPATPGAATVTFAVYVPAASPVVLAVTVSVCGASPEPGETLSHGASPLAVKLSVPPPSFATASVRAAGWRAVLDAAERQRRRRDRQPRRLARADRPRDVRRHLGGGERPVVDPQLVEPPGEPLAPDVVAAEPQRARRDRERPADRGRRDLHAADVLAQRGAVIGRRRRASTR